MPSLPSSARIREVGPRDGFQNEPEVLGTAQKVELIEALAGTGLKRLEVTSFVRPDVIPQLADAEQVLVAIEVPADVSVTVLIPNERGLDRALALRESASRRQARVRRGQRLPLGIGDPQPPQREPLDRGLARGARAGARPRARCRGCAARV